VPPKKWQRTSAEACQQAPNGCLIEAPWLVNGGQWRARRIIKAAEAPNSRWRGAARRGSHPPPARTRSGATHAPGPTTSDRQPPRVRRGRRRRTVMAGRRGAGRRPGQAAGHHWLAGWRYEAHGSTHQHADEAPRRRLIIEGARRRTARGAAEVAGHAAMPLAQCVGTGLRTSRRAQPARHGTQPDVSRQDGRRSGNHPLACTAGGGLNWAQADRRGLDGVNGGATAS
jgi:hypothetical protein